MGWRYRLELECSSLGLVCLLFNSLWSLSFSASLWTLLSRSSLVELSPSLSRFSPTGGLSKTSYKTNKKKKKMGIKAENVSINSHARTLLTQNAKCKMQKKRIKERKDLLFVQSDLLSLPLIRKLKSTRIRHAHKERQRDGMNKKQAL
jgi:hypothetical protein